MQKTIRSRFNHEVGELVEGCTIIDKKVVIPPEPSERRLGVYDYVVDVPPAPAVAPKSSSRRASAPKPVAASVPERGSFTRATPAEMSGAVIRRLPPR
jgi:hypothetical protein